MFASEFRRIRQQCGFTQSEVEEQLCLPKGTVLKWETGKKEPSLALLVILSDFFMCTTDTLLGKNS